MARSEQDDEYDPGFDRKPRRRSASGGSGGSSTFKILAIVFGIVGLIVILVCGGLVGYGVYIYQPKWTNYTNPDGSYSIKFPNANTVTRSGNGPDNKPYTSVETTHGFPPSQFFVRVTNVTANETRDEVRFLDHKADVWAREGKGTTEVSRQEGRYHSFRTLDLVLNRPGDKVIVLRFVLVGNKLYTLGVDSNFYDEDDDPVNEFLDSFEPAAVTDVNKK